MDLEDGIESKTLGLVDWILFAALLVVSLGIGIFSSLRGRGNNSKQEYLVGGKMMSPIPVGISLLGGVISAVSILIQMLILPIMYPLGIVSANEYISLRFGSETLKKFVTVCCIFNTFVAMGFYLYAPSLTLSTVTNLSTYSSVATMGVICTFYITFGGVKAVVYTDVIQTLMMFLGVLIAAVVCIIDLGGPAKVYQLNYEGGRLEFFNMDTDPLVRHTFWSVQVQGYYNMVAWIGLNQPTFQRFVSVSTLKTSKSLCTFFLVGLHALYLTFYLSGIAAYATYSNCDPLTSGRIEKTDQILPYLILDKLSHLTGMAGLFVAAVYGGVLSSLSSAGNSVACLMWEDLLKDLKIFKGMSDVNAMRIIKTLSAVSGIVGIGVGILVGQLGSIMQVATSIGNAMTAAVTGLFISGMCAPWVNLKGTFVGYVTALIFNLWLVVGQFIVGMGHPEKLPLTTDGCPENINKSMSTEGSLISDITGIDVTEFFDTSSLSVDLGERPEHMNRNIYHLSYCYTGMLGIIVHVVVSTVVSVFTGPTPPDKIEARLASPRCLRFYKYVWALLKPSTQCSSNTEEKPHDKENVIPMTSRKKIDHIDTPE